MASHRVSGGSLALLLLAGMSPARAAIINVNNNLDQVTDNGNCTLREAFQAAQTNTVVDTCPPGEVGAEDVINVPAGTYLLTAGPLQVSGQRLRVVGPNTSPPTAVLDANFTSRVLKVDGGSVVILDHLRLTRGDAFTDNLNQEGGGVTASDSTLTLRSVQLDANRAHQGGGLLFVGSAGNGLVVQNSRFEANRAEQTQPNQGAGLGGGFFAFLSSGSFGQVEDSVFTGNQSVGVVTNGGAGYAGGRIWAVGDSTLQIRRCAFTNNLVDPAVGGPADTAGLSILGWQTSQVLAEDLVFTGNQQADIPDSTAPTALSAVATGSANVVVRRIQAYDNDFGEVTQDIVFEAQDTASLTATNILAAHGPLVGVSARAYGTGTLTLGHITTTDHGNTGLFVFDNDNLGHLELGNSISFGNGSDLFTGGTGVNVLPSNLIGIDPLFVNPATGDYSLQAASPAVDAGNSALASVGPFDALHHSRVAGAATDLGALERGSFFADGFESGDLLAWSSHVP